MRNRAGASIVAAAIMLAAPPSLANGGGGGGGGGMPSQTAPSYNPAAEYQKGAEAFQAGRYDEAAKAFQKVVAAVPRNPQANYLLGASYLAKGDFKRARAPLEAAVRYDGTMIDARHDLGIVQAGLGKADKAAEQRAALQAMADACASRCGNAAALAAAIAKLDAAIAGGPQARAPVSPDIRLAEPASLDASYVAAVALINEQRYEQAITLLDAALWTAGPHPDLLTYLGFANRKLKHYDAAEAYYGSALAIAPTHRGALEYYGELKLERGDAAGARAHLAKLEAICGFGCQEADELRRWIVAGLPFAG